MAIQINSRFILLAQNNPFFCCAFVL